MAQTEDPAQLRANEIAKALKGPVQEAIRRVERLGEDFPSDKDFHFYNNFLQFKSPVRSILSQTEALLNDIGLAKNLRPETSAFPIRDPDASYDWLVALQDDLVEGIDAAVDQLNKETSAGKRGRANNEGYETPRTGVKSDGSSISAAANKASKGSSERRPVPFHVKSIPRPQIKFEIAVDNSNSPFKHPQAPKAYAQEEGLSALDLHARKLGATFEDMHPLEDELTRMEYVDPKMLEEPVPQEPRPIAETPLTVVSSLLELNEMAAKCRLAGEIAVDLENHHYRSFQGFVCLMQVSTRAEDFIVDTLALRSHISPCLKDIFADSRIRKVLHGADRDIVWLQRDFGIYVCNMFDTGQAARVLQLEGFGLAFLMQHFLNMNPDKRYQLADWRIRPLPAEMIKYAREDTHYLLYLYDLLRVQLVSMRSTAENDVEDPLLQVYKRSRDICLLMYKKDILTETSYLSLYGLQDRQLNPEQMSVLAGLYAWRDKLARKLDESTGFVLPNQLLYKLAEEMPDTARTLQNVIRGPHSLVGQHAAEVLEVIKQSKEKAPVMSAPNTSSSVLEQSETKSTSVGSDGLSAEMDTVNTITTQEAKTVSDAVLESMEEDVEPVSANCEDVNMKSTTVVEPDIQEQEQPCTNSKAEVGETTTSIKEITVGPSMSPEVMVQQASVEDTNPASTINIRKLNTAVVKRASVPSLALFGGSSKKKIPALNVGSSTKTKPVETKPVETKSVEVKPVETSSRPGISSSMIYSEVTKLSNAVVQDIPEGVIVTAVLNGADDGKGGRAGAVPSSGFALYVKDSITGAAGVAEQAVEVKELMVSEGGTASVTPEVMLGTNLTVAGGSTEHEQESRSAAVVEAPSQDAGPCGTDASPKPLSGSYDSEDVVLLTAEEEKASVTPIVDSAQEEKASGTEAVNSGVSPGESASLELNPTIAVVNSRRVSGAAAWQGLGSMLGSSAHRKRQKRSNEDMEMVAAKLRAHRIQASVSLPFHRVPSLGEQDVQMLSTPIPAEPGNEPVSNASPSSQPASLGLEAAPFEELGDYVTVGNTKNESENGSPYDVATKTSSNRSEEKRPFPTTLNEMRRQPRGKHPVDSSLTPSSNPKQQHKKQRSKSPATNVESTAGEAVLFQPFDYEAARREAGLGDNLVISRKEDVSESGRGRGRGRPVNPNKRQKQVAPPSTGGPVQAFDPLRRARQEPRPEGIPAAKRRQVFPQSGNRTASFRR